MILFFLLSIIVSYEHLVTAQSLLELISASFMPSSLNIQDALNISIPDSRASRSIIPLPASGNCVPKDYVINSVEDLFFNINELECIFSAGLAPEAIGLGYYYGTLLTALNSAWPASIAPFLYQGDYVIRTKCNEEEVFIGTLHIGGISIGTALWTVDTLDDAVADGEYYDGKPSLVMDFRWNPSSKCKIESDGFPLIRRGFFPFQASLPPVNAFVDIGRVVGVDAKDGGLILLNKALVADPEFGYSTVMFYAVKTFDKTVLPSFVSGTTLSVTTPFEYKRKGLSTLASSVDTSLAFSILNRVEMFLDRITNVNPLEQVVIDNIFPAIGAIVPVLQPESVQSPENQIRTIKPILESFLQSRKLSDPKSTNFLLNKTPLKEIIMFPEFAKQSLNRIEREFHLIQDSRVKDTVVQELSQLIDSLKLLRNRIELV